MLSVSRAPWASRCGARLTLSVFLWASVDPTLRRLRAPLSGANLKVRPQGGFWRYAPGGRRGAAILSLGASRFGCSGEAALHWARGRRGAAFWPLGGVAVRLLRGSSPTLGVGVAVRLLRGGSPTLGAGGVAVRPFGRVGRGAAFWPGSMCHQGVCGVRKVRFGVTGVELPRFLCTFAVLKGGQWA